MFAQPILTFELHFLQVDLPALLLPERLDRLVLASVIVCRPHPFVGATSFTTP